MNTDDQSRPPALSVSETAEQEPWTPGPPTSRPARSLAGLMLLALVFVIGIAVGSSGALGRNGGSATGSTATPPMAGQPSTGPAPSTPANAPSDFGIFWEALDLIQQKFVGRANVDPQTLTYGAIRGMVQALGDTGHTVFLTPEQAQAEQDALNRNVVGIGVLIGERDGQIVITSVVPNSPAQAAGLKAGDIITAVDGKSTQGLSANELVQQVRGDAGTAVTVSVLRPTTGESLDFTITRETISFPSVSWTMVPGTNIALIRYSQFGTGSSAELVAARDAALAAGATSIVLDLRGNPGGYVDEAVRASSVFLHDKVVYILQSADGSQTPVKTNDSIASTDVPVVVLVDNNTASSAEIVSGALQDAGRAPIVGQTTFGTGTVLNAFQLSDGSVINLAVQRWLTPNGELIFGKGITPDDSVALGPDDVPIEPNGLNGMTPAQLQSITDRQLQAAIAMLGGPTFSPAPSTAP